LFHALASGFYSRRKPIFAEVGPPIPLTIRGDARLYLMSVATHLNNYNYQINYSRHRSIIDKSYTLVYSNFKI